jgi:cyclic-di-GMP phosphodiesterase, flagellum assembly factor TipF
MGRDTIMSRSAGFWLLAGCMAMPCFASAPAWAQGTGGITASPGLMAPTLSILAFVCALAALGLAFISWRSARQTFAQGERLLQAFERLAATRRKNGDDGAADLIEMGQWLSRRLDNVERAAQALAKAGLPMPVTQPQLMLEPVTIDDGGEARDPVAQLAEDEEPLIVLQPILAVAEGKITGFEAVLRHRNGEILRRPSDVEGLDRALFERRFAEAAFLVARREIGSASTRTPVHVAISRALLTNDVHLDATVALIRAPKGAGASVTFSVPAATLQDNALRVALSRLTAEGAHLAIEGWAKVLAQPDQQLLPGLKTVKLNVRQLLEGADETPDIAWMLRCCTRAGMDLVASEVASDKQAMLLMDVGVEIMTGPCFSPQTTAAPAASDTFPRAAE